MDRIDSNNAVASLPELSAPETSPGYFTDAPGQNGTVLSAAWLNAIQEELINVITAGGIEPNRGDFTQLLTAIMSIILTHATVVQANQRADDAFGLATDNAASLETLRDDFSQLGADLEAVGGRVGETEEGVGSLDSQTAALSQDVARAMGTFTTMAEAVDLDAYYSAPGKLIITHEDSVNLPETLALPTFLEIKINDASTLATQVAWDSTGLSVFTRCATVDLSDGENPEVAWTAWQNAASPPSAVIVRGKVKLDDDLEAGAEVVLDHYYVVGSNRLLVFFDNVLIEPGSSTDDQYVEVGDQWATSQTIQVNFGMPQGSLISYLIFS